MVQELPGPRGPAQITYLRRLLREPAPVLDELAGRYGRVFGLGAGPMRLAVVGDATALREMWELPLDHFRWGHRFNVLGFVVGDGSMIVSDGDAHRRRRGAVQRAFSRRRLNGWIPMIVQTTDAAIDALVEPMRGPAEATTVDLYPTGRALTLRIAVHALFGERLATRAGEIGDLFERPQAYLESPGWRQIPHPLPGTRRSRVRNDRRALDRLLDQEIADRRHAATDEADADDILASLVHDGTLTDAEIRDQVVTLVGAGYDTTAASLAWMLWSATSTPGLWDRLRVEADAVLDAPDGAWDHTHLAGLDLAAAVMRETLRLHPPGLFAPREARADLVLGGRRIRRGTLVLWSPYVAGRDPATWDEPLQFDPDRWLRASADERAAFDRAWVPFGRGARNCIGFALAQMELTLVIARLAQRLDVIPTRTHVPEPRGMVVNRPAGGVPMLVAPRPPSPAAPATTVGVC